MVLALFAVCGNGEGDVRPSLLSSAVFCDLERGVCDGLGDEAISKKG